MKELLKDAALLEKHGLDFGRRCRFRPEREASNSERA